MPCDSIQTGNVFLVLAGSGDECLKTVSGRIVVIQFEQCSHVKGIPEIFARIAVMRNCRGMRNGILDFPFLNCFQDRIHYSIGFRSGLSSPIGATIAARTIDRIATAMSHIFLILFGMNVGLGNDVAGVDRRNCRNHDHSTSEICTLLGQNP
jgi:putative effector of murein hydrolase